MVNDIVAVIAVAVVMQTKGGRWWQRVMEVVVKRLLWVVGVVYNIE